MKRFLVHLMLGFLICITSLQGVAAGLLACCGPMSADHSHAAAGKGAAHPPAAAADKPHAAHAAQACAACVVCCSLPAALPPHTLPLPLFHVAARSQRTVPAPAGHIPDTPERPPRRTAA